MNTNLLKVRHFLFVSPAIVHNSSIVLTGTTFGRVRPPPSNIDGAPSLSEVLRTGVFMDECDVENSGSFRQGTLSLLKGNTHSAH